MPNTITISGNLTADPELRKTSSEVPFTRLRVAVSHRVQNQETRDWEDRQDGFFVVTAWRELATHSRMSLQKGDRVTVTGKLIRRAYEATIGDGQTETRHIHEIEAEDLGPSLRWQAWSRMERRPMLVTETTPAAADDDPGDADEPVSSRKAASTGNGKVAAGAAKGVTAAA